MLVKFTLHLVSFLLLIFGFTVSVVVTTELPTRRRRYAGKYPRKFSEKYKELRGDEAILSRVIEKGGTPAGTHIPIMLKECLDHMRLPSSSSSSSSSKRPVSIDCTLGYGGHTVEIMKRVLALGGMHIGIDQDEVEIVKTEERIRGIVNEISDVERRERANKNLIFVNRNFRDIENIAKERGVIGEATSIIADLGFSSMQIDDASRGFTYKSEGPLDMRMNRDDKRPTASELLMRVSDTQELTQILDSNSDEPFAQEIAEVIMERLPIQTTAELATAVRDGCSVASRKRSLPLPPKHECNAAIARTMQAIRIEVNAEFEALDELLNKLPDILAKDGTICILTFHSGEDRRVKKSFKSLYKSGVYSAWSREVVVASNEERRANPRSKCAKLRWAIKA